MDCDTGSVGHATAEDYRPIESRYINVRRIFWKSVLGAPAHKPAVFHKVLTAYERSIPHPGIKACEAQVESGEAHGFRRVKVCAEKKRMNGRQGFLKALRIRWAVGFRDIVERARVTTLKLTQDNRCVVWKAQSKLSQRS